MKRMAAMRWFTFAQGKTDPILEVQTVRVAKAWTRQDSVSPAVLGEVLGARCSPQPRASFFPAWTQPV